jgi:hypothetical protein
METPSFHLGLSIAAAARGIPVETLLYKKAAVDTLADHKQLGYGALQRVVCKYAAEAFKEAGKMTKFAYHMYNNLAHVENWYPELDDYYDAAVMALGKVHGDIRKEAQENTNAAVFNKQAGIAGNLLAGIGKITPEVWKTLLAAGSTGGVVGGTTAWLANRSVEEDAPKLQAMKEKIKYYNQLTDEIETQLAGRRVPATKEEVEEVANNII